MARIRNPFNQTPHPTQDTIWESDKNTRRHHIHESQEVSPFPAGDHKAAKRRQDSKKQKKNNKKDPQQKHRHVAVSKKIFG